MHVNEIFKPHPHGPIQPGAVQAIVASLERYIAPEAHSHPLPQPEFILPVFPEAPPQLIRRAMLRPPEPQDGASWIPWAELPSSLFWRLHLADECKRQIYQAQRHDQQSDQTSLTPAAVQQLFAHAHPRLLRAHGRFASDFDLHDVYVCAEATLLEFYDMRTHDAGLAPPHQQVNERLLAQFQAALTIIGQALPVSSGSAPLSSGDP